MGSFGGYYKGEKKKAKKDKQQKGTSFSDAPTFVMPEIIKKKDKNY